MIAKRYLGLVLAGLLPGCAANHVTTGSISPIKSKTDDFKVTVVEGAVAGALVGGIAGALIGGDTKSVLKGAAIGGGAGLVGGYMIAGRKQQYARREDALEAVAADCRDRNHRLSGLLATTNEVITRRRGELARLKASTGAEQQRVTEQQALLTSLEADKAAIEEAIAASRTHGEQIDANIAEMKRQFPDERTQSLDEVASSYRNNAKALEQTPQEVFRMIDETSRIPRTT